MCIRDRCARVLGTAPCIELVDLLPMFCTELVSWWDVLPMWTQSYASMWLHSFDSRQGDYQQLRTAYEDVLDYTQ